MEVYFDSDGLHLPVSLRLLLVLRPNLTCSSSHSRADTIFCPSTNVSGWLNGSVRRYSHIWLLVLLNDSIGLARIVKYLINCRVANLTPDPMRDAFKARMATRKESYCRRRFRVMDLVFEVRRLFRPRLLCRCWGCWKRRGCSELDVSHRRLTLKDHASRLRTNTSNSLFH